MRKDNKLQKVRGIYLFPNLLTTAGLFAAFYAVIAALKGLFDTAAIAIFIAMIMDSFDGRVARLTHTESPFGAEYDSLSDMVAFGVAPALVIYSWALGSLGKMGWLAAFVYTASVALRLARFNTQLGTTNKRYFQGLPSPAGAAVIASLVWFCHSNNIVGQLISLLAAVVTVFIAILMVSNIRYYSFKEVDLKGRVPFVTVVLIVLIFVSVSINPPFILLLAFSLYAVSGPLFTLFRLRKTKRFRRKK